MRHYISTGDSVLVEASPYDAIWGIRLAASSPEAQDSMKWRGQNLLGFALMEVRDELRRVTQNEMLCDWSTVWQQRNSMDWSTFTTSARKRAIAQHLVHGDLQENLDRLQEDLP